VRQGFPAPQAAATQNGDWVRQGRNIIIVNCPGATVSTPSDAPEPAAAEPAAAEPADSTAPPSGSDEPPV
jgi:hypothetical protein